MTRRRPIRTGGIAGLALAVLGMALALLAGAVAPAPAGAAGLVKVDPTPLQGFKPFDLGVADANNDGNLDLFTTNHKFPSRLLIGDGGGGLFEARVPLGLSPTPEFPGFEDLHRVPDISSPGLYLYATDRGTPRDPFRIDTTAIPASGRIVFGARDLRVEQATNATYTETLLPSGETAFDFEAEPGARIDLTVDHIDLPIDVDIDTPESPASIKVGPDAVPASRSEFQLSLRDRHGYGFADFNSDGASDLFVATGGLGGEITDPYFLGRQRDEFLLGSPTGFRSAIAQSGLNKGACRGRGATIADFDGDGLLDLLESCDEATPRLFAGDGAGRFREIPAPPVAGDVYRAIDLADDRRPEIVAAAGESIQVWSLTDLGWVRRQAFRGGNTIAAVRVLAQGDFDNDADPDLFAASPRGNAMLMNVDGRLRKRTPRTLGLPNHSTVGASFVDYDNDGDLDLHALPQGIFRNDGDRYRRTERLEYPPIPGGSVFYGTASWPDLDEDGRRDPVSMRGRGEFAAEQVFDIRHNELRSGHWLELDLVGPPGNRQAIGARVKVTTDAGSAWGWVGEAETSAHSSGHYRVYFGLGDERRVRRIVVTWADGSRRKLGERRADRVLRVRYGGRTRG